MYMLSISSVILDYRTDNSAGCYYKIYHFKLQTKTCFYNN